MRLLTIMTRWFANTTSSVQQRKQWLIAWVRRWILLLRKAFRPRAEIFDQWPLRRPVIVQMQPGYTGCYVEPRLCLETEGLERDRFQ
jgi:hypothetical protein